MIVSSIIVISTQDTLTYGPIYEDLTIITVIAFSWLLRCHTIDNWDASIPPDALVFGVKRYMWTPIQVRSLQNDAIRLAWIAKDGHTLSHIS